MKGGALRTPSPLLKGLQWLRRLRAAKVPWFTQASGLAVLAFEHAAPAQLIRHGHDGVLVGLGDEAGFVESAVRAARDRPGLSRIGAAARDSARALDWSGVVERFEDELRSVVSPVSPGASVLPAMTAHTSPLR